MTDFRAEMAQMLATDGKAALGRLSTLLKDGGTKNVRRNCEKCNQLNTFEVPTMDHKEVRETLEFLTSYTQAKPKDDGKTNTAATRQAVQDLTDDQLHAGADMTETDWQAFQTWHEQRRK